MLGGIGLNIENGGNGAATSFQNCQFGGGEFDVDEASCAVTNCLWDRVVLTFDDDDHVAHWCLLNNLFRGGHLYYSMHYYSHGTSAIAYDNLFDRTTIYNGNGTITNGYNGYVTNCDQLSGSSGNDVILTNSPIYQTSYLGNYYYPTNGGLLSTLIDRGSRWATNAGLYHFTTTTNQVKEGSTRVDIGFHYVAIDPSTGQPYDYDRDGIPDYLEDANGNGVVDSGETDWQGYNSLNGLTGASGLEVFTPLR